MANINARTRLLIGTTAQWAANDLVLGDGELVIERAANIKLKVGDGAKKFSALAYVSAEPIIPSEYLTDDEGDARYLLLTDVKTTATANKVPRLGAAGTLAFAMLGIPSIVAASAGAADAGKLVALDSTGKVDSSMIQVTSGTYKGTANVTAAKPAGTFIPGDYFLNTGTGLAHASWGLPGGTTVSPGQQVVFNGTTWDLIGGAGSAVSLGDGSATAPSLSFLNSTQMGLFRVGADLFGFTTAGAERWRMDAAGRWIAGGVASQSSRFGSTVLTSQLQVHATTVNGSSESLMHWGTTGSSVATLSFAKGKSGTIGTHTAGAVASGDLIGRLTAAGSDGSGFTEGARINFAVDGTPAVDSMPGRIEFLTTAGGAGALGTTPNLALTLGSDNRASFTGNISAGSTLVAAALASQPFSVDLYNAGGLNLVITNALTDAANKGGRIAWRHYTNAEEAISLIGGTNSSTLNKVQVGGGSGSLNAATSVEVYAAANNTTLTGTIVATFDINGLTAPGFGRFGGSAQGTLGVQESVSGSGAIAAAAADGFVLESSGSAGMSLLSGNGSLGSIYFGDIDANAQGRVTYNHASDTLTFYAGNLPGLSITSSAVNVLSNTELLLADVAAAPSSIMSAGFRGIPQNSQSANYTLVLSDAGKHIYHPAADTTARTWTIPANTAVAFPVGTSITFVNNNGAGTITIAITTDTLRLAGAGTTGSRTLAPNGIATAVKVVSNAWIISGTGLS